jgi:tetraprenyl-beta-curcumene synthase
VLVSPTAASTLVSPTADSPIALTATFLRLAGRYWVEVFPRVSHERRRQHARASRIPDPLLRRVALESQRKWGNIEGAAAFATLVPRRHRAHATRAMVCFQAAYNYLDLLAEQPSSTPAATGRQLHSALLVALDLPATAPSERWTAPLDDGGYLPGLIEACRAALSQLPSYVAVAPVAHTAAERIVAFQSANACERLQIGPHRDVEERRQGDVEERSRGDVEERRQRRHGDLTELERWAREITPPGSDLYWWETAAAGGSSMGVYALMALACQEPAPSPASIAAVAEAYFPWIGALHSLLDNLVDVAEDRATGQHSLSSCYASSQQAAARMGMLAERSLQAARALPDARAHTLVLAAMASFYLSMPQARAPQAQPVARAVLDALGRPVRLTMPVFSARQAGAGHRVSAKRARGVE